MPKAAFGAFFKELRIKQEMTLRQFCDAHGYDAGNISKLERGLLSPPESEEKLTDYARALKIRRGPDHAEPLRTANFISQQDIGGDHTDFINDADIRNDKV